jgi:hypothetical protein
LIRCIALPFIYAALISPEFSPDAEAAVDEDMMPAELSFRFRCLPAASAAITP